MDVVQLKEKREAQEVAESEFQQVKRRKLETERNSWKPMPSGSKEVKQKERGAANRASAAASRAKMLCFNKELGVRIDKLERQRNEATLQAQRISRRNSTLTKELSMMKQLLTDIWQMKEHKTCSYLMDSNALFLLQPSHDNTEGVSSYSEDSSRHVEAARMYDYKASPAQESIIRHSESSSAKAIPSSHPDARQRSPRSVVLKTPPSPLVPRSSPVRNSMSVRSLVHPSNSDGILHGDTRAFGCLPP